MWSCFGCSTTKVCQIWSTVWIKKNEFGLWFDQFCVSIMHLKQINRIVSSRCRFFLLSLSLHIFLCVWISISNIDWNWCEHCDVFRNALKHCVLITKFYYVQNGLSHFFAAMNKSQFKEKIHFKGALKFILRWRVVVSAFLFDRSVGRLVGHWQVGARKRVCVSYCVSRTLQSIPNIEQ